MPDRPTDHEGRVRHWEGVYERNAVDAVSWYQEEPVVSLALVEALCVPRSAPVVDVGGGASVLVTAHRLGLRRRHGGRPAGTMTR
ncbi:MAG: hypothetical protein M0Z62_08630 [Actinomycetota bacterium]|nr:hypothetical protein [Actinomycetota bacterium]